MKVQGLLPIITHKSSSRVPGVPRINLDAIQRQSDGSIIVNATPMRFGDHKYAGWEVGMFDRDEVIGRLEESEVNLDEFLFLPVTNDHCLVNSRNTDNLTVGRVLQPGILQKNGYVETKVGVHDPLMIIDIEQGKSGLSIGFFGQIELVENPGKNDPDFYWRGAVMNHLAVIPAGAGKSGPKAALHGEQPTMIGMSEVDETRRVIMPKIKIGDKEFEVDDDLAKAIEHQSQVNDKALSQSVAAHSNAAGQVDVLKAQVTQLEKDNQTAVENAGTEATKRVAEHAKFAEHAKSLGYKDELKFGEYEADDIRKKILSQHGVTIPEDANQDRILGAFDTLSSPPKTGKSVIDGMHSSPEQASVVSHQAGDLNRAAASRLNSAYMGENK